MRGCLAIIAVALCVATCGPALAQAPAQRDCAGPDPNVAITACTSILAAGKRLPPPVAVPTLRFRGEAYVKLKDYDHAIADYTAGLRIEPNNTRLMILRGVANRIKGEYDTAIADYDTVLRIDPNNAQAYNNRGYAYRWKSDYDRALADLNQAIRIDPNYALAYSNRAIVYRLKLDFAHAIADNNQAIRFAPQAPPAYAGRAATYEAQGDLARALADYRQAQALGARTERIEPAIRRVEQRIASAASTASAQPPQPASPQPAPPGGTGVRSQQGGQPAGTPQVQQPNIQQANAATGTGATQAATAARETRVALVIGNGKYANAPTLANPTRDAQALASTLQRVGFNQVTLKLDLPRDKMLEELRAFASAAEHADWAVVYFAGHGLEVGGVNYLVPTEAKLQSDRDVSFEGVPLEQVLQSVEGARKLGLVVLDACRDNPFVSKMTRSLSGTRSVGTGLANIEPEGAVLVAYAAKHGQTALDGGAGANSPFMTALLKNLETPGLEINLLFRKIHDDVMTATGKRQEPFTYGSLPAEAFYFKKS